jgi:chloramphenicol-sensitive protein RarD
METTPATRRRDVQIGLLYGIFAYAWWGAIPVYFKLVKHIAPVTVLAHRILWSFVFLAALITARAGWNDVRTLLSKPRILRMLAASTLLLASNWGFFIYAVSTGRVLEASLGYFIVPLMSVAMGVLVLKERLRTGQISGLVVAVVGVVVLTVARGTLPWLALVMAFSWGGYALIRKIAAVGPLIGATVETAMLVPIALIYIITGAQQSFSGGPAHDYFLLMLGGVVTAIPLLAFAAAALHLRLTTLGFLQYLAPIGQFLLAVFAYGEKFDALNIAGFTMIWIALVIYTIDSARAYAAAPIVAEI